MTHCFSSRFQWEVRKEALDYLGHVYKKECINAQWSDDIQKQLTWVANCIIHLYYQKATQDKLLAERLLTFYLMPWDVNTDDKVRVLLTLYSNVSENAQRWDETQKGNLLIFL